jgi:transposase
MSREELIVLAGEQAGRLAAQDEQITALASQVADLVEANQRLAAELARLQRLLSRNSGNSSLPPSMDDLPGRRPPEGRDRRQRDGGRRPGKQPGAPGSHLAWSADPDGTIPHFPDGACACGAPLAGAQDLGVAASHQVVDIPLQTARVTQHDLHEVACGCGRVHRAPAPAGAGAAGTVSYGLALQAWCVYLIAAHAIPVHRCAELVQALTGARPSPGFVHSMIERAAAAVAGANRAIRALIILAHVVSADETPLRAGPGPKARKKYLMVACTNLLTYYFLGDRSMTTFEAFVLPDLGGSVVVHDRYQNYDAIPGLIHQLCCQHLIRDCEDAAETYPAAIWPGQIRDALRELIHQANLARDQGLDAVPAEIAAPLIHDFKHGVLAGLSALPRRPGRKQLKHRALLEDLRDRHDDVLRFAGDLRIPPTSNQAERDLRPAKTQQKISGRLRSEQVTRHRYAIRGYISTAAKHGAHVLTAIHDALAGNPWMPPIPDPP